MKSFTADAIQARLINTLKKKTGWTQLLADSAITSDMYAHAESNAEIARYLEYLIRENKWGYARNISSLLTQAPALGYKPHRKIAASGLIYLSHDPQLQYAGITNIFSVEDLNTYLTNYSGSLITIPKGTVVSAGSIQFITTQDASYPTNTKYISIPVVQATQKSVIKTSMLGNSFETIRIVSSYIEAGTNATTSQFFSVLNTTTNGTTTICTQVDDIYLADYNVYAYDVTTARDYSYVDIRFGNGIAGAIIPAGSSTTISYLETLGSAGDVASNFVVNTIKSSLNGTFYCTNFAGILGGKDEADIETIRAEGPANYLLDGGITTINSYKATVNSISSIITSNVYYGKSYDNSGNAIDTIYYTAINKLGEAPEATFMEEEMDSMLAGKIHPEDYYIYQLPEFVHIKIGIKGISSSTNADLASLDESINIGINNKYGTLTQTFQNSFDNSKLISYLISNFSVNKITSRIEAVTDLKPSEFIIDDTYQNYYTKSFVFNRSFNRLRTFTDGVLHCLKIQLFMNCPSCIANSRTLLVIQDDTVAEGYRVAQFHYISDITDYDFVTKALAGSPVEIKSTDADYIPIWVTVNLNSFNPADPTALGTGVIRCPLFMPNGTDNFINFNASSEALDSQVFIQVIGEPFVPNINPYYAYDIIKLQADDSLNTSTGDVKVEIANE